MPAGDQRAFLQFSNTIVSNPTPAGATATFSLGAQPDPAVRVHNIGTATVWVAMGLQSTSSASVTTQGMMIPPGAAFGCLQIFRTGGNLKIAAYTVGATQTGIISFTGGEGM